MPVTSSPWLTRRGAAMLLTIGFGALAVLVVSLFVPPGTPTDLMLRGALFAAVASEVIVAACLAVVRPNPDDRHAQSDDASPAAVRLLRDNRDDQP